MMRWHACTRVGVGLTVILALIAARASGQTVTWFDINPSRSSLDADNPNGASGGRVNHLGAANDFSKVYAATEWGGLYQSFDQGATWVRIQTFSPSAAWDVDPTNGSRAIVSGINSGTNAFEIWMTPDFGATWTRLTNLETLMLGATPAGGATFLNRVSLGRNTPGTLNFGAYWQPSLFAFNPVDPTTILAGAVDAGVFLSLDNGTTWSLISNPVNPTSAAPHIPRPLFAYFSPGRFRASTSAFDVWVGTRGAGVVKAVVELER